MTAKKNSKSEELENVAEGQVSTNVPEGDTPKPAEVGENEHYPLSPEESQSPEGPNQLPEEANEQSTGPEDLGPDELLEATPSFEVMAAAMAADILSEFAHMSVDPNPNQSWKDLPKETQDSMVEGVKAIVSNPNTTPEENHYNWMTHKGGQGWQYGDSKNVDLKRSPDMVSWNELKPYSRTKNVLFLAVVKAALKHMRV